MRHHFEKEAALPIEELVITALEHAMGGARPGDVERELTRQGVIIVEKDGKRLATTEALQEEENRLAAFALDGRGTVAPIGLAEGLTRKLATGETLSDGQWDAARGLLESENRVSHGVGSGRCREVEACSRNSTKGPGWPDSQSPIWARRPRRSRC